LIVALDLPSVDAALESAQALAPFIGMFKINIHLFTSGGPAAVQKLHALGPEIFLDLKFHDIPNTVRGAVAAARTIPGIRLLNVHALGGAAMMQAAADAMNAAPSLRTPAPALLAVTILTSMSNDAMREVGISGPASRRVVSLAKLSKQAGMDGVVASPQEVKSIRRACGKDFLIVVPGIRPELTDRTVGTAKQRRDDQARVATPAQAIRAGADFLVVGRPITAAPDPAAAARSIVDEIAGAMGG
jgi:orotidine-5'-phosphate decarboxylase